MTIEALQNNLACVRIPHGREGGEKRFLLLLLLCAVGFSFSVVLFLPIVVFIDDKIGFIVLLEGETLISDDSDSTRFITSGEEDRRTHSKNAFHARRLMLMASNVPLIQLAVHKRRG